MIQLPVTERYYDQSSTVYMADSAGKIISIFFTARDCLDVVNKLNAASPVLYLVRYKGKAGIYPVVQEIGDEICILVDFAYAYEPANRALRIWQNKSLFEIVEIPK